MRFWTEVPCTCGLAKSKIKGRHHDISCERGIARREQHQALMAKTQQKKREKRETKR